MNIGIIAIAALIPLVLGWIWYHPMVLGKAWMGPAGMTEEKLKAGNMIVIFLLTYILSFFVAFSLQFLVIHQMHLKSILMNEPGINDKNSEIGIFISNFIEKYGNNFRTFKHGMLHGTIAGITLALPVVAVTAMFERKGFKYIAINAGFWIICFMLMGGVVCAFA
ncbi:MAG: DUF1761 domain-containing protein [Bacteroidia bacterium]